MNRKLVIGARAGVHDDWNVLAKEFRLSAGDDGTGEFQAWSMNRDVRWEWTRINHMVCGEWISEARPR